jgi:alcohol dehydrogenase (cytochrome c)
MSPQKSQEPRSVRAAARSAAVVLGGVLAILTAVSIAGGSAPPGEHSPAGASEQGITPDTSTLLNAGRDDANWILPARTYSGNRYTGLAQIDRNNVASLKLAWSTQLADDGEQEAAPLISQGRMYLSTPHDGVVVLDAATGRLIWQAPYNPAYVLLFAANRGVGLADGKVFIATQDCQVVALDAATGKKIWSVQGCRDTSNSFYSMAAYVYKDEVIVGTGGGDNGNIGLVSAFSAKDGKRLWDWQTIPGPGEPGHETWPGDSWKHGGGAVWNGITVDQDSDTLFITPGNAGPDMVAEGREGKNFYTNSLVALDISGRQPKLKWHYQFTENDTHDTDPAMIPVLFEGKVGGQTQSLVAAGDKAGNFVILERQTGKLVYRMALSKQEGIDTPPTVEGIMACPNHGGGIEWNGGAYDPASNTFLVPSTDECAVFKLASNDPPQYVPGQPYEGGALPKRQNGTGVVSAIDVGTGKLRWRQALPYPAQGGVLVTATGLAFTSDIGGNLYAFDAATGEQHWKTVTGSAIVAPISAYSVNGTQYLTVVVGEAGNQQTPNLPTTAGSRVLAFSLGDAPTIANDTTGQVALANAINGPGESGSPSQSQGSAPYTREQAAQGAQVYAKDCGLCHGANLQGVSAPALTGPSFGRSHLNASQLRTVVTQTMPLTAPASLTPDQYAAVMAYLLSYDCVPPTGGGKVPFPTTDSSALANVILGGTSCPH